MLGGLLNDQILHLNPYSGKRLGLVVLRYCPSSHPPLYVFLEGGSFQEMQKWIIINHMNINHVEVQHSGWGLISLILGVPGAMGIPCQGFTAGLLAKLCEDP